MCFWTYGLQKTWLDKRLKSPLSEDPFTSNMVNGSQHCSKPNEGFFTLFIYPCVGNSSLKSLSQGYAKS